MKLNYQITLLCAIFSVLRCYPCPRHMKPTVGVHIFITLLKKEVFSIRSSHFFDDQSFGLVPSIFPAQPESPYLCELYVRNIWVWRFELVAMVLGFLLRQTERLIYSFGCPRYTEYFSGISHFSWVYFGFILYFNGPALDVIYKDWGEICFHYLFFLCWVQWWPSPCFSQVSSTFSYFVLYCFLFHYSLLVFSDQFLNNRCYFRLIF